jgi:hypothetical protein
MSFGLLDLFPARYMTLEPILTTCSVAEETAAERPWNICKVTIMINFILTTKYIIET